MKSAIRNLQSGIVRIAIALVVVFVLTAVVEACPTCKDSLADTDPNQKAMAAGYYYSILFMMAMPFAILGTFGSMAYFSIRRARSDDPPGDDLAAS